MQRVLVLVVGLAGLILTAPAVAKDVEKIELCGPSSCEAVDDPTEEALFGGGGDATSAPPVSSFYRIKVTSRDDVRRYTWTGYFVADSGLLGSLDGGLMRWQPLSAQGASILRATADRVRPFPAPTLSNVRIGNRRVTGDLDSYLRLFSLPASTEALPQAADWTPVWMTSKRPSPWTDGAPYVHYSPSANLVQRGAAFAEVPSGLASDIEAARTLSDGGGSILIRILAAALAAGCALVAAVAVLLALRRRRSAAAVGEASPA